MPTGLDKLFEQYHLTREDVLWELLRSMLNITFGEPRNEDETCRVFLDGHGVEIVHLSEEEDIAPIIAQSSLVKLSNKLVCLHYKPKSGSMGYHIDGILHFEDSTDCKNYDWRISGKDSEVWFSTSDVKSITKDGRIYLK